MILLDEPVKPVFPAWNGMLIHVIGVGTGSLSTLGSSAVSALQDAQMVIGAQHQLDSIHRYLADSKAQIYRYPSPLQLVANLLFDNQNVKIVLLASGDPLFFGIGSWLNKLVGRDKLVFHANISSVQAACAKLGRAWQDFDTVSLHGRPLASLRARLQNFRSYAILPDKQSHPVAIAQLLSEVNYQQSQFWIVESIGTDGEIIRQFSLPDLLAPNSELEFDPLHVTIVDVKGESTGLPEFPGIDDRSFITDGLPDSGKGMISKKEVRLNILSLLSPQAQDVGWDVGAGCGAVAVEWARWNRWGQVYAIESHSERYRCICENREKFGVINNLHSLHGSAPDVFANLPKPNVIFVGGSNGKLNFLLADCWAKLEIGGRLVVSAVTAKSRAEIFTFAENYGVNSNDLVITEISVSRFSTLSGDMILRPLFPVLLAKFVKTKI